MTCVFGIHADTISIPEEDWIKKSDTSEPTDLTCQNLIKKKNLIFIKTRLRISLLLTYLKPNLELILTL
jgi:hypothetical protein